jgi:predicted DCC family thiol-disulfide oxidoreductase YuxK
MNVFGRPCRGGRRSASPRVYHAAMTSTDPLPSSTTPPPTPVILYDGNCRICERESRRLIGSDADRDGTSGDDGSPRLTRLNFHEPGVLDRFPGITHDQCMQAMVLIDARGRVYHAAEAVARALAIRSIIGRVALLYYIPGVRQLCDRMYRWIAERRYRLSGCPDGACDLHRTDR